MVGFGVTMLPVLLSIGPITISSFGFFLALSFLYGTFIAWRLARAWDLDEEKILDICLLTFFGGLLGARILFVATNFSLFNLDFLKIALLTKYPGLNLWGALLGGGATIYFFSKRIRKLSFWQVADLAGVGILGGLILGNIGCLLGGCNVGVETKLPIGIPMVGYIGSRLPTQILEVVTLTMILRKIWPLATHFHFTGKIISLILIWIGLVEFLLSFLKEVLLWERTAPILTFGLGVFSFYYLSKRSLRADLVVWKSLLLGFFTTASVRKSVVVAFRKSWYNQKVALRWSFYKIRKKSLLALRRRRVKPTPGNI